MNQIKFPVWTITFLSSVFCTLVVGCSSKDSATILSELPPVVPVVPVAPVVPPPTVSHFALVPSNGDSLLTLKPGSDGALTVAQIKAVPTPGLFAVGHPNANFVYALTDGGTAIRSYAISSNGTLTELPASVVNLTNYHEHLLMDPLGRFLFTADNATGLIKIYSVNTASGALTSVVSSGTCGVDCLATMLAIDAIGKHLYVAAQGSDGTTNGIYSFNINQSTGAVTAMTGSPYLFTTEGNGPYGLIVSGDGKYLISGNTGNTGNFGGLTSGYSSFAINSTNGQLTYIGSLATSVYPLQMATDSTGKIYSSNGSGNNTLSVNLNAIGLPISTTVLGAGGVGIGISSANNFAYSTAGSTLSQFSISAGPVLTPLAPASLAVPASGAFGWATFR